MSPQFHSKKYRNPQNRQRRIALFNEDSPEVKRVQQIISNLFDPYPIKLEFVRAKSPQHKRQLVRKIEKQSKISSKQIAGDMHLELAHTIDDLVTKAEHLDKARQNWQATIEQSTHLTPNCLKACIQLAHLEMYQNYILFDKTSDQQTTRKTISQLADLAGQCYLSLEENNMSQRERSDIIGLGAELSILALNHRFNLKLGCNERLTLPSFITQDQNTAQNPFNQEDALDNKSWDVSVFSQYDQTIPPKLDYKLQVKTRKNSYTTSETYDDDIAVIYVLNDLDLRCDKQSRPNLTIPQLLQELYIEQYSQDPHEVRFAQRTLDLRTERMLDVMG